MNVVCPSSRDCRGKQCRLGLTAVPGKDGDHDRLLAAVRGHGDPGG